MIAGFLKRVFRLLRYKNFSISIFLSGINLLSQNISLFSKTRDMYSSTRHAALIPPLWEGWSISSKPDEGRWESPPLAKSWTWISRTSFMPTRHPKAIRAGSGKQIRDNMKCELHTKYCSLDFLILMSVGI